MKNQSINEDIAWIDDRNGNSHLEPTYSVDWIALLDGDPEPKDERLENMAASELLVRLFQIVMVVRPGSKVNMLAAFRQFCVLTWLGNPAALGNISLRQLAAELHCTPAALGKYVQRLSARLGIRNPMMKREGTRETYSRVQLQNHWRRRLKKKPSTPGEMPGSDSESTNPKPEAVT